MERFRPGIVAIIKNKAGQVLLCERSDTPGSWQFPQGGIERGESPKQAVLRELQEELGTSRCRILASGQETTRYRWPKPGKGDFVGQEHHWFLAEFFDHELPLLDVSDGSFSRWKWEEPQKSINQIVNWKQESMLKGLKLLGLLE